jgi:hypothetical protein
MGGASPGLKVFALLLTFPRPEGLGTLRCGLECRAFPPIRKEREWTGHPFFVRIGMGSGPEGLGVAAYFSEA